jgi:trigger factor
MIERQVRYLMERNPSAARREGRADTAPTTEETRKAIEGRALRQVQATLLVEKISVLESVTVSDDEVRERIDNLVRAAGERAKTVREVYSRPEAREDLRAQMVFERTLDFLLERATIKEPDGGAAKVDDQGKKS